MTTFLLVPGAGGRAWYWHRLVPLLSAAGHRAVAVDLPAADARAGWREYRDAALAEVADVADDVVVVGQSMGGPTAGLVALARPVREVVLLNAMIPLPGETGGDWWSATGQPAAARAAARAEGRPEEFDVVRDFFHDVPADVTSAAMSAGEPPQADTPFTQPWPGDRWPDIRTRVLVGTLDRLFPVEFQRQVARERLGLDVQPLTAGHLAALARPDDVARALIG
jgi:pimeloyl-ACP methyl ester carboxylesterase